MTTPSPKEAAQIAEDSIAKIADEMLAMRHLECEDSWYSCPLSEEGCADERKTGCTCSTGHIHELAQRLRSLAPAPVGEPVASATEKLSELMRGLEIPPAYGAFDAHAFFVLGQKIAEQAKAATAPPSTEADRRDAWKDIASCPMDGRIRLFAWPGKHVAVGTFRCVENDGFIFEPEFPDGETWAVPRWWMDYAEVPDAAIAKART